METQRTFPWPQNPYHNNKYHDNKVCPQSSGGTEHADCDIHYTAQFSYQVTLQEELANNSDLMMT